MNEARGRNQLVLSLLLISTLLLAIAQLSGGLDPDLRSGLRTRPATIDSTLKAVALLLATLPLAVALGRSLKIRNGPAEASLPIRLLVFSLALFAIGQILIQTGRVTANPDVAAMVLLPSAVSLVYVFYSTRKDELRRTIPVATYLLVSALMTGILVLLMDTIEFSAARFHTRLLFVGLVAANILILFLPAALLNRDLKSLIRNSIEELRGVPVEILGGLGLVSVSLIAIPFFQVGEDVRANVVQQLGWVMLIIIAALTTLKFERLNTSGAGENRDQAHFQTRWPLWALVVTLVAYSVASTFVAIKANDDVGPDGLAYLSIAEQFSSGRPVVRGYWSPLISWMAGSLMVIGIPDVAAIRAIGILAGAAWIIATYSAGRQLSLATLPLIFLTASMGVLATRASVIPTTPDVLGSSAIMIYFAVLLGAEIRGKSAHRAVVVGALGAIAYYAKYYNLPFFILHITLASLIMSGRKWKSMTSFMAIAIASAAILVLPWLVGLENRYNVLTISTSGAIGHALVGPGSNLHHPCWRGRLCDLPGDVIFPWEDPQSDYYPQFGWSPFGSIEQMRHQSALVFENAFRWFDQTWLRLGLVPPLAILVSGLATLVTWKDWRIRARWLLLFITPLIYASGYFFTWSSDTRYYYPVFSMAILAAYFLTDRLISRTKQSGAVSQLRMAPIAISFLILPLLTLIDLDQFRGLYEGRTFSCLSEEVELADFALPPPMAGTNELINFIAYKTGVPTYGVISNPSDPQVIARETVEYEVATLVIPSNQPQIDYLVDEASFRVLGEFTFCDSIYMALGVPAK